MSRPLRRWPLPVVTGICVAAFIGLALSVSGETRPVLGLPATAYRSVVGVPNSTTTGLYPADEELVLLTEQLR